MDQRPSHEPTLPTALIACALLLAVALLFMSFADGRASGETWVYRYQTLIAGVLALGAAWWTVQTMQTTDLKAHHRHEQIMDLSIRADRLRIERALNPQSWELQGWHERAVSLKSRIEAKELSEVFWDLLALKRGLEDVLSRQQFLAGAELFGGDLAHRVLDMQRWTHDIDRHIEKCRAYFGDPHPKSDEEDHEFTLWLYDQNVEERIAEYVKYCTNLIPPMLKGMREIGDRYGVNIQHFTPSPDQS